MTKEEFLVTQLALAFTIQEPTITHLPTNLVKLGPVGFSGRWVDGLCSAYPAIVSSSSTSSAILHT